GRGEVEKAGRGGGGGGGGEGGGGGGGGGVSTHPAATPHLPGHPLPTRPGRCSSACASIGSDLACKGRSCCSSSSRPSCSACTIFCRPRMLAENRGRRLPAGMMSRSAGH